jgi:1,4-alpha-glucan branching enzyme
MPKTVKKLKVTFKLSAPRAQSVLLAADFTRWEQSPVALKQLRGGLWKTTIALAPGSYEYRFLVDGQWWDDPDCPCRRGNCFGTHNSVCEVGLPGTEK